MRLTTTGFRLQFTVPMNAAALADAARYRFRRFRYIYHQHYGSPRVDEEAVAVKSLKADAAGASVELDLAKLEPGFVYQLELDGLTATDGRPVGYPEAYYTLNRTLDGRRFQGSITAGPAVPPVVEKPRPADLKLGARVYTTFCAQCHRVDGKGGGLPGVGAADFTRPGGPLTKPDDELARRIAQGIPGKTMPPFGYVLSQQQIVDVLGYVRSKFAPAAGAPTTSPVSTSQPSASPASASPASASPSPR
jgi:mono/diheme cytochrome c family protein